MKLLLRVGYPSKLTRKGAALLHDIVCWKIDTHGEASQESFSDCLPAVIAELRENHVISWVKFAVA